MSAAHYIKPRPSCDICGKTYKNPRSLTIHKRIHTGERPYKCDQCARAFMYFSSYSVHMVSAHWIGGKYIDPERYDRQPGNQIASNSRQSPFKCEHCGRTFVYKSSYNIHLASAHKLGNHKQPSIQIASSKRQPGIPISDNDRKFGLHNRISGTSSANKNQTSDKPVVSNDQTPCRSVPTTSMYGDVPEPRESLECHICQRTFSNNMTLKSHMRMHAIPKPLTNSSTNVTENNNYTLHKINEHLPVILGKNMHTVVNAMMSSEQHQTKGDEIALSRKSASNNAKTVSAQKQNLANDKRLCKCEKCGETCINKEELAVHKCTSKRCSKCYKPFKTLIRLKLHVASMHPKSHKYACTICGLSFKTPLDYTNHKKSHSGELEGRQIYECSVCKSKLYTKKSFMQHKRLHKPFYQCRFCKECFGTKEEQIKHSKYSHVRNRPYDCSYCEFRFRTKFNRDRHEKRIHKGSVQISLDNKSRKKDACKAADDTAATPYSCTQCNRFFSHEYLLLEHDMKMHWKEDNKVNETKQINVKRMKENSGMAQTGRTDYDGKTVRRMKGNNAKKLIGTADNDVKRYVCDTCGTNYTQRSSLTRHIKEKHLVPQHAKGEQGNIAFKHSVLMQPHLETVSTPSNVNYRTSLVKKKKELNEALLREYFVYADIPTSCQVDPDTNKMLCVCEVCSTTYTCKESLVRHIRNRAYDHGFYLRRKGDLNKMTQLRPRFECDVCGNIYTRRYNMLSHRQMHTKREFKDVSARKDLYKAPDGGIIITDLELDNTCVSDTDEEVSSSTTKTPTKNQTCETSNDGVTTYTDREDGELDDEPFYTARPYFAEKNKDTDLAQIESLYQADNAQAVYGLHTVSRPIEGGDTVCCDQQSTELQNITATSTDMNAMGETQERIIIPGEILTETDVNIIDKDKSDQISTTNRINRQGESCTGKIINTTAVNEQNETTEGMNILGHTNTVESINTTSTEVHVKSTTHVNTRTVLHKNILEQVSPNEIPIIPEQYTSSGATGTGLLSSVSTIGCDKVCTECKLAIQDEQKDIRCKLCDQIFCVNCSGLPRGVYNVLYSDGKECSSGIWWSCNICKHLVPKFTLLLQQLGDFEQIINNNLTDMEQRLSMMGAK